MSLSMILTVTHSRDIGRQLFRSPSGFSDLGIATTSALPDLWNFELVHAGIEEVTEQDLRVDPAWGINFGKMESHSRDFLGFRRLRAAANVSGLNGSEIL